VQAASVSFMTLASLALHNTNGWRLQGASEAFFENPNDLALNIVLNLPFCFAFLLLARGGRKAPWMFAVMAMLVAVLLTYSRSGFLALVLAGLVCLWEFGVKGRRFHLVLAAVLACVLMVAVAPRKLLDPPEEHYAGQIKGAIDRGSADARTELLKTSLHIMAQHPLLGIGPGCFPSFTAEWVVAHNTYTEMGAECGIPALILFILALERDSTTCSCPEVRAVQGGPRVPHLYRGDDGQHGRLHTGAVFADTAYNLFPYFLIAYTCALRPPVRDRGGQSRGRACGEDDSSKDHQGSVCRPSQQPFLKFRRDERIRRPMNVHWQPRFTLPAIFLSAVLLQSIFLALLPASFSSNTSPDYTVFYGPAAQSLLNGKGLVAKSGVFLTLYPPGFCLYIAAAYHAADALGAERLHVITAANVLCMAVGCVLVFCIARRIFGERTGWISAALWITYVFNLWLVKQPNSEIAFHSLFYGAVFCFILSASKQDTKWAVLSGLLLGWAGWCVRLSYFCPGVLGLFFLLKRGSALKRRALLAAALVAAFMIAVLPWEWEVYRHTGQIVPLSTNGPSSMLDGATFIRRPGDYAAPAAAVDLMRRMHGHMTELQTTGRLIHYLADEFRHDPLPVVETLLPESSPGLVRHRVRQIREGDRRSANRLPGPVQPGRILVRKENS